MKTTLTLIALGMAVSAPAFASPVTMPAGGSHILEFDWNADIEEHWLLLASRMPALVNGTERVARTGLADAHSRQADLRAALAVSGRNAEGGVWVRVGGRFGEQDGQDLSLGRLSAAISDLPGAAGPIDNSQALAEYGAAAIAGRWADGYLAQLEDEDWFDDLDAAEQDAVIVGLVQPHIEGALNLSYDEQISHFNVGADFIFGERENGAWIAGGAIGYVRASQEFDDFKSFGQGSKHDWDAVNLGAYASYIRGPAYIDASLSYGWHSIDMDMPSLGWQPDGAMLSLDAKTLAAQIEAGWRFDLREALYVEPQLSWTWVRSQLDTAQVQRADALTHNGQFNTLDFGDQDSQRIGLGAELGHIWALGGLQLTGLVGARYWNERDAESTVQLYTPAERVALADPDERRSARAALPSLTGETSDNFTQLTLGARLQNADGNLGGALQLDRLAGGDYESWGITASFRYQW